MWFQRFVLTVLGLVYLFTATGVAHGQTEFGDAVNGGRELTLLPSLNTEVFKTERDCTLFLQEFENQYLFSTANKGDFGKSLDVAGQKFIERLNSDNNEIGERAQRGVEDGAIDQGEVDQANANAASDLEARDGALESLRTEDVLACAIVTGRIKFSYIPFFATHILQLGMVLAGVISMLFVMIGGYKYAFSGLTEDKEGPKKTIQYAIGGLIVASFSWIIVEIVQIAVSGGF